MRSPLTFVLSPSYHGATLLSILLDAHPEVTALGDTVPHEGQTCACEKFVAECEFWQPILKACRPYSPGGRNLLEHLPIFTGRPAVDRLLSLALAGAGLLAGASAGRLGGKPLKAYLEGHAVFRREALKASGAKLFVDGQKSLTKALLHRAMAAKGTPVRIIHLTRDPRGFLASDKQTRNFQGIRQSAENGLRGHQRIAKLSHPVFCMPYHRVRYEDLCTETEKTMASLFRFLDLEPCPLDDLRNPKRYHYLGNKMLHRFDGSIRLSTRWRDELSPAEAEQMLEMTNPLSQEYGHLSQNS